MKAALSPDLYEKGRIDAAWAVKDSLVLSMPSSRGGQYLIGVTPVKGGVVLTHQCPSKNHCWHEKTALESYKEWRWWEPAPENVTFQRRPITLSPEWEQIPVPGVIPSELEEALNHGIQQRKYNTA